MLSGTDKRHQSFAAGPATLSIGLGKVMTAQRAEAICRAASRIVRMAAGKPIGQNKNPAGGCAGSEGLRPVRTPFTRSLADRVCHVALQISAFLKSITSTPLRKSGHLICNTPRSAASSFGKRKLSAAISKSYARIAIGLKRMISRGREIACRRVAEAYAQPDLFVEPPKAPKQEALL